MIIDACVRNNYRDHKPLGIFPSNYNNYTLQIVNNDYNLQIVKYYTNLVVEDLSLLEL